jgi:hypothetical protein
MDTLVIEFMAKVDAVMVRDQCERHVAMQTARSEDPDLFEVFQMV